ncbi:MAG TPA: cupredoxin domain-containing protein [Syntrophorhabdaceae bacterium]|nr:cupredoxin domain-containing protein [Syntrophorhabdaceae bacterium]
MGIQRAFVLTCIVTVFLVVSVWGQGKQFVAVVDPDGVQRVQITAGNYFFDPSRITVKANVPVEMTIKKEPGVTPHDIILKAPEAGIDISQELSTEPATITFTPTQTGDYIFYCDKKFPLFKSHRDRGMEGLLTVVP